MTRMRTRVSIACAVSLAAIVGCQTAPTTGSATEGNLSQSAGGRGQVPGAGNSQAGANGAAVGQNGQAGTANTGALNNTTGSNTAGDGTVATTTTNFDLSPDGLPMAKANATPDRAAVLSKVDSLAVTATQGGLYKSADGRLEAMIPPEALSADANVKFAAVDTSALPATAIMTPGIMFAMDLGGASLLDGKAIMVKSKVDPRFVEEIKRSAPGVDVGERGLSQDAQGIWYLTMPVKGLAGPDPERLQATQVEGDLATVELQPAPATFGLKQAAEPTAGPTATPVTTPEPTPTPAPRLATSATGDAEIDAWPGILVSEAGATKFAPVNKMRVRSYGYVTDVAILGTREATLNAAHEYIHCFVAHGWCPGGTVFAALDDAIKFNKSVGARHEPPNVLTERVNSRRDWDCTGVRDLVNVSVQARYKSDDATLDGAAAADATVSTNAGGNVMQRQVGADGNLTFPMGVGVSFTLRGSIDRPEFSQSAGVSLTSSSTMAPVRLDIPKYSPKINLTINSDSPLPGSLDVEYTLDGMPQSQTVTVSGAPTSTTLSLYVKVANDAEHTIKLTRVSGETVADNGRPAIGQDFAVHRNGIYPKTVTVNASAPK